VSAILEAADTHRADVIGMSGLLVKSTVVMKENLEEMNTRGISAKFPVILGGAALTRPYVEQDLAEVYEGEVRYARDAFEGLRLMDALINVKRGVPGAELPALRPRRVKPVGRPDVTAPEDMPSRSDVSTDNPVPEPPFWGSKVVKGIQTAEYAALLDERATFMGQWGLKSSPWRRAVLRRSWSRPRAGRGCAPGWSGCTLTGCSRRPSSTATTRS
jgi:5-methyltetrahydrofolate--homocysteine methyltransferase